jgi:membrane protease subunit HflK
MSTTERPGLRPVLLVLGAMFAFSLMALFAREAQANILGVAAWRAVFVAAVFGVWAVAKEGGVPALKPDPVTLRWGAWLGLALAIASSTFVGGYALTTVANTIFLHNLAPVVVFPLAWWLFQERANSAALAGAGIALVGVALLTGVSFFQVAHFANAKFLLGDMLALVSAIGYAAVLVLTRLTRKENTPILGTLFIAWTVAAAILVTVALLFGGLRVPSSALLWILGLAVISTNLPFYLLNLGMRQVSAGMAAVLSLSEVLFATALGMVVYGEHLAPIGWIGAALAGLGVLYAVNQRGAVEGDKPSGEPVGLEGRTQTARVLRLLVGLVLLNGGVALVLSGAGPTAPLLAVAGLLVLARYGPGLTNAWLDGRFARALRWGAALIAAAAAGACFMRAGALSVHSGQIAVFLAVVAVAAEILLVRMETDAQRDAHPLVIAALLLFVIAHVARGIEHGMADVFAEVANFTLGWSALGLVLAGLGGTLMQAAPGRGGVVAWFEGPARWAAAGRRPWVIGICLWIVGAVRIVPTGSVGIIERFGAPLSQTDGAGLFVRLPPPIETLTIVDVSVVHRVSLIAGNRALLTGDHSMIDISGVLHFKVSDAERFAYGTGDPDAVLAATARAALIEVVIRRSQDSVLTTGRKEVEHAVLASTQLRADALDLGVEVVAIHLNRTAVPPPVLGAFLDVISADEERLTAINEAEAYAADAIPVARGEAIAVVLTAQGDEHRIGAAAIAEADVFDAVSDGGKRAPALNRARLTWESLEHHLGKAKLILAPADVRVWWGGESSRKPVDVPDKANSGSTP